MSQNTVTRRLRPWLFTSFPKRCLPTSRAFAYSPRRRKTSAEKKTDTLDYRLRVEHHEKHFAASQWYPRLGQDSRSRKSIADYRRTYEHVEAGDTDTNTSELVAGRVQSVRKAGSKLMFIDIKQDDVSLQAVLNVEKLTNADEENASDLPAFNNFESVVRKGDWYQFNGHPYRSKRGELSILATSVPRLLSPALHHIPEVLDDPEIRAKNRHVDMLVHLAAIQTVRVRHLVEKHIRDFFDNDGFTSVHTPLLTAGAGGAVARPFQTEATELEGQKLDLRIAPELWLKRLVVGGIEKVYEFGPAFRNEGVDATHNPEFYICEFYEAFAVLDGLMQKTERLLSYISSKLDRARQEEEQRFNALPPPAVFGEQQTPFKRVEFIPALQERLGHDLPDLSSATANEDILSIFKANNVAIPTNPTLPRLLDALASHYIEPLSQDQPVFIIYHPACLSPLSKTFRCHQTNQLISARAELFIAGREIANMYEEENSPFEQRKKFEEQLKYREVDGEGDAKEMDESYLSALEWGMPPTGGWGCGVDRLVMLFSGRERIGDVLPFGTLRNVVGLGKGRR